VSVPDEKVAQAHRVLSIITVLPHGVVAGPVAGVRLRLRLALAFAATASAGVDLDIAHGPRNVRERRAGGALDAVVKKDNVTKEIKTLGNEVGAKREEEIEGELIRSAGSAFDAIEKG
jgi:hypothetical protein